MPRNSPSCRQGYRQGMRTVQVYEIESHKSALNWIALNDRDALTVFIASTSCRISNSVPIDEGEGETRKEAF